MQSELPPLDPKSQALVLVDFTPAWLQADDRVLTEVWDRLWMLINEADGVGLPIVPVNINELTRVDFRGIRSAFVAGCFGRLCVDSVAEHLRGLGILVHYLIDGIVWSDGLLPDATEAEYQDQPFIADVLEAAGRADEAEELRARHGEWMALHE